MILKEDKVKYKVNLSFSAEEDLYEIFKYVYLNDSEEKSERLYSKLYEKCVALKEYPYRGHVPQELSLFGINDFLEIIFKHYRIIYQIIGKDVFIHCILDGRRDIQKLLQERLIRE